MLINLWGKIVFTMMKVESHIRINDFKTFAVLSVKLLHIPDELNKMNLFFNCHADILSSVCDGINAVGCY